MVVVVVRAELLSGQTVIIMFITIVHVCARSVYPVVGVGGTRSHTFTRSEGFMRRSELPQI